MFEISVEESFAAGHSLRNYRGKCENPHGHNYRVRVTLQGPQLDTVGLLYDFVHLKQIINDLIRALDHKFLNDLAPFDVLNPSAENIAKYFYDEIHAGLQAAGLPVPVEVAQVSAGVVTDRFDAGDSIAAAARYVDRSTPPASSARTAASRGRAAPRSNRRAVALTQRARVASGAHFGKVVLRVKSDR